MPDTTNATDTERTTIDTMPIARGPDLRQAGLYSIKAEDGTRHTVLAHYTADQEKRIGKERPAGSEVMRTPEGDIWRAMHAAGWGVVTGGFTHWWAAGKAKAAETEPTANRASPPKAPPPAAPPGATLVERLPIDTTDTATFTRSFLRIAQAGVRIPEPVLASFRAYARITDADRADAFVAALKADFADLLADIDTAQMEGRIWCGAMIEKPEASTAYRRLCRQAYGAL